MDRHWSLNGFNSASGLNRDVMELKYDELKASQNLPAGPALRMPECVVGQGRGEGSSSGTKKTTTF